MIEFAGFAYAVAKEAYGYIKEHFEVKEIDPKLFDYDWVNKSGFDKACADEDDAR